MVINKIEASINCPSDMYVLRLTIIPIVGLLIAKKSIVGSIPDIVFCAIDTGSLTIPALWGGILFGVVEAIAGGVIGDALTNVVAGFFEGGALLNGFEKGKL